MAISTGDSKLNGQARIKMNAQEHEACMWFVRKMKDLDMERQVMQKSFGEFMDGLVTKAGDSPKKNWGIDTLKGEIYEIKPEVKQNDNGNVNNTN